MPWRHNVIRSLNFIKRYTLEIRGFQGNKQPPKIIKVNTDVGQIPNPNVARSASAAKLWGFWVWVFVFLPQS